MATRRIVLALVLPAAVGPATSGAQVPIDRPADRLMALERQRDDLLRAQASQMVSIQSRLDDLPAPVGSARTLPELAAALRRDSLRVALLEEVARRRVAARFELQALRYHTGLEVLRILVRNTEKLDYTTGLATSLAAFDAAANPLNSPAFREELAAATGGREKDRGGGFTLPDLLLKNPIVSTAVSLASLFSSALGKKEKEVAFARIGCVLDFTTRASRDANDLKRDLDDIDGRVKSFLHDARAAFGGFSGAVGSPQPWDGFRRELATNAARPRLADAIDAYFERRKSDALARPITAGGFDDLVESNYQLDVLRTLLTRHEDLLLDTGRFLERFELAVRRYEPMQCDAIPGFGETIGTLVAQAAENRTRFETGWTGDVSAKSRALLFMAP